MFWRLESGKAIRATINARTRRGLAVLALAALCGNPMQVRASGLLAPAEQNRLIAQIDERPMVFYVAKGTADSCGPGCNEWIAAEGTIVPGTGQRFREFMEVARRELPIFFDSRGGFAKDAMEIALILRERRMTAGVGRTIPEQCRVFDRNDTACQRLLKSGTGVKARFVAKDAQCNSACVYAFVGGSVRRVPAGSLLGVHSGRTATASELEKFDLRKTVRFDRSEHRRLARLYLLRRGVDPRLEDLAATVSTKRIHVLSHDEIAQFGMETRGFYETQWIASEEATNRFVVLKSVTLHTSAGADEYLTTTFQLWCDLTTGSSYFGYSRELPFNGTSGQSSFRVTAGEHSFTFYVRPGQRATETGVAIPARTQQEFLVKTLGSGAITLTEMGLPKDGGPTGSKDIKLATAGLSNALAEFSKRCPTKPAVPATTPVSNIKVTPTPWPYSFKPSSRGPAAPITNLKLVPAPLTSPDKPPEAAPETALANPVPQELAE